MKYLFPLLLLASMLTCSAEETTATSKKKSGWFDLNDKFYKKRIYLYWGYNRDYYLKSDIYIHGPGYNFTLYNVSAIDKQSPFSAKLYFSPTTLSIPQYNYRAGIYLKYNIHLSLGLDHLKYVVMQNQTVRMTGNIDATVSQKYAATDANKNVVLTPDFIQLQHTNGLNLITLEARWQMPIYHTQKDIIHIGWNFGLGTGFVVTRTEFHFMDVFYYNPFHLSGWTIPVSMGPRIDIWKCFFFSAEAKAGEVFLPWAPAQNTPTSGIHQHITFLEYYIVGGLSFSFDKNEYPRLTRKKKPAPVVD